MSYFIGLECKTTEHNVLKFLFTSLGVNDYDWIISEDEVILQNHRYLLSKHPNINEFNQFITNEQFVIIFINVQGYKKNSMKSNVNLVSYQDFMKSACEIIVLISDGYLVEIYCKDRDVLRLFAANLKKSGCKDIKYKTLENDGRTKLSVV